MATLWQNEVSKLAKAFGGDWGGSERESLREIKIFNKELPIKYSFFSWSMMNLFICPSNLFLDYIKRYALF